MPGFAGIDLPVSEEAAAELNEPYIYHFPDGNASIARLLVRSLVPGVAPGRGMEDIVLAPFDYARLDTAASLVRLRLRSTAVHVRNTGRAPMRVSRPSTCRTAGCTVPARVTSCSPTTT
jgi:spermidine dehydrogenase